MLTVFNSPALAANALINCCGAAAAVWMNKLLPELICRTACTEVIYTGYGFKTGLLNIVGYKHRYGTFSDDLFCKTRLEQHGSARPGKGAGDQQGILFSLQPLAE